MIKNNIAKWVFASVCKHFTDNISGITLYIEGLDRNTYGLSDWCELRLDGPNIREVSKNLLKINAEVNILIATHIDVENLYHETENINKVIQAYIDFDIYKYGNNSDDTGDLIGRFKLLPLDDLRDKLQITRFGILGPALTLMQTTTEGHYEMLVDEEEE